MKVYEVHADPNGSCLFEAGLPTDIVGRQNFLYSSITSSWRANNNNNEAHAKHKYHMIPYPLTHTNRSQASSIYARKGGYIKLNKAMKQNAS